PARRLSPRAATLALMRVRPLAGGTFPVRVARRRVGVLVQRVPTARRQWRCSRGARRMVSAGPDSSAWRQLADDLALLFDDGCQRFFERVLWRPACGLLKGGEVAADFVGLFAAKTRGVFSR